MAHRRSGCPFVQAVRRAIRARHYSLPTEDACPGWIERLVLVHGKRCPARMDETKNNRGQSRVPMSAIFHWMPWKSMIRPAELLALAGIRQRGVGALRHTHADGGSAAALRPEGVQYRFGLFAVARRDCGSSLCSGASTPAHCRSGTLRVRLAR